jgi:hypothetical protein
MLCSTKVLIKLKCRKHIFFVNPENLRFTRLNSLSKKIKMKNLKNLI